MKSFLMKKSVSVIFTAVLMVYLLSFAVLAGQIELVIFHTNDTHGRLQEGSYDGMGFARIKTIIDQERSQNADVLVLDAGDTLHGQIITNLVKGESAVKVMNKIGYDAMAPGNHDFNYGQERLIELNKIADFPVLAANVLKGQNPLFDPYIIKEVDGIKVAIFGLATPETTYKTHPDNVAGLDFANPIETARKMVAELKDKADLIVALTHLGVDESSEYTSKRLAEEVTGIDVIIDGHSHSVLEDGLLVNNTLIAMAGEYDKYLGKVTVKIEDSKIVDKKAELISKEEAVDIEPDSDIETLLADIQAENDKITSTVIGKTSVELNGEREYVRTGETNMGDLITDAILASVDADCVITNGGGIRASIPAGEVTKGDIIGVLPFGNFVVVKKVSGSDILDAIEHGISAYPAAEGMFPHIAGMSFIFAAERPAGERVVELKIDGENIDYNKDYLLATNDFMAAGGDGYTMFTDAKIAQEGGSMEEVVMAYIKDKGTVSPEVDGRVLTALESGYEYYTVQSGDTLSEIAQKYNVSLNKLVDLNNLQDSDWIIVGDKLLIPQK